MRLFYVALSRARNLLVLPRFSNRNSANEEFGQLLREGALPTIRSLDIASVPVADGKKDDIGKCYSYTGDYIPYLRCPRNYMVFHRYGFVPSRGQSMFFGRLVHETIEDLHHMVMASAGEGGDD
jgi:DNA helicase-2/ATP-dependent DNA helicase PcrA